MAREAVRWRVLTMTKDSLGQVVEKDSVEEYSVEAGHKLRPAHHGLEVIQAMGDGDGGEIVHSIPWHRIVWWEEFRKNSD